MSKFRRFTEYLNAKGDTQTKPKVDPSADTGPDAAKTPAKPATKGKNWKSTVPLAGTPTNYASSDKPVGKDFSAHPKGESNKKGFADEGDGKLKYEPKTDCHCTNKEGKPLPDKSWPKPACNCKGPCMCKMTKQKVPSNNEEFLATTKGMTLAEFTQYVSEQNKIENDNLPPCSCDPVQAARYVAALANANNGIMETVVRELKRLGAFDKLVTEVFKNPEAYNEVAFMLADEETGAATARRLIRALHETVDAPASETEGPASGLPIKGEAKKPHGGKGRRVRSLDGGKLDMGSSDVVMTKVTASRPEHNLINAILGNKMLA
jgi:hypothetical protein